MIRKNPNEIARPIFPPLELTVEQRDLLRRRTMPFVDDYGMTMRPLSTVLEEVYMQGIKDAMQAILDEQLARPRIGPAHD